MGYQINNPGFSLSSDPCADKLSFLSEKEANAGKIQAKWDHDNQKLKVYHCEICGLYHLATVHENDDDDD